jgi:hypothetical protein
LPSPSVIIRPAYLHERTRQLSRGKKVAAKPLSATLSIGLTQTPFSQE